MKYGYWLLPVLLLLSSIGHAQSAVKAEQLYRLDENDVTDKMILAENSMLDSIVVRTPVWLSDEVDTQLDPLFGVIINKKRLLQVAARNGITDIRNLVRLTLAHEKMHALQLMRLQAVGRNFAMLAPEERQVLECQADMCAGYAFLYPRLDAYVEVMTKAMLYRYRVENTPNVPLPTFDDAELPEVLDMVKHNKEGVALFFALGDRHDVLGSHPAPIFRKEAFHLGQSVFYITAFAKPFPQHLTSIIQPAEWAQLKIAYEMVRNALAILPGDYNQFGNFFESWSYRQSIQIMRLPVKAANQVEFHVTRNRWDTSLANNFLYFSLDVTNRNPDSVLADLTIPVRLVMRDDPDNPLTSRWANAIHKMLVIPPGATVTLSDSVMWVPGGDTAMPRVCYPGEEGSMYTIQPIRPHDIKIYQQNVTPTAGTAGLADVDVKPMDTLQVIRSVLRTFRQQPISYFKHGAGLRFLDVTETGYQWYIGNLSFDVRVPLDAQEAPFMHTRLAQSATRAQAKKMLEYFRTGILSMYDGYTYTDSDPEKSSFTFSDIKDDEGKIFCSLMIERYGKGYQVTLEIER